MSSKGKFLLYAQMKKALYGILHRDILVYINLVKDLVENGFQIIPYDPCVVNKIINDKQMTIVWPMEDLKASHFNSVEITKFEGYLYINDGGITVNRGKVHN